MLWRDVPNCVCKFRIFIYYQTLFWQILPDILTNLGRIWRTFRWAKYEKMSQNIRRYLEEKCLIIYLLCIYANFNLKTVMPKRKLVWPVWLWKLWNLFFKTVILIYLWLALELRFWLWKWKMHQELLVAREIWLPNMLIICLFFNKFKWNSQGSCRKVR